MRAVRQAAGVVLLVVGVVASLVWWKGPGVVDVAEPWLKHVPQVERALGGSPNPGAASNQDTGGVAPKAPAAKPSGPSGTASPAPSTKSASAGTGSTVAPAKKKAGSAGCGAGSGAFVPQRVSVDGVGSDLQVLSRGEAADGSAGTPPLSMSWASAWFTGSAKPGSSTGSAVFTAHTFRQGGALGNALLDHASRGDVVRVAGAKGRVQCFQVSQVVEVSVANYDPSSTLIYDDGGNPRMVFVVCSGFDWSSRTWTSRTVIEAVPVS